MPPLMPPVLSHLPILLSHSGGAQGGIGGIGGYRGHRGAKGAYAPSYAPCLIAPTNFAESFGGHRGDIGGDRGA